MMKSKIHRARVTESNLEYEGSITIDEGLLEKTDIQEYEQVQIYNVTNGERFTTYAIRGGRNSGVICVNGAAAHKAKKATSLLSYPTASTRIQSSAHSNRSACT